jgi:hypothetical protein
LATYFIYNLLRALITEGWMQQTNFINNHEQILRANRQTFQKTTKLGIPLRFCCD